MDNNKKPLVSICCITYNHERFISQCLDGFLMQNVDFPFEIVISDDCSTDNTKKIIDTYVSKYPAIFKDVSPSKNLGSTKNFYHVLEKASGKYIALCDGDDYWIDENKLQMQVDFLETNPEYGMCYTKAKQYNQNEQKFNKKSIGADFDGFEDLLKNGNRIPTLTTVYRKDLLDKYQKEIQPSNKGWLMGDYPKWLYFSHESKVKFIDKVTAVYRVLENSASHNVDIDKEILYRKSIYDVRDFYSKKYDINIEERDENKELFYILYRKNIKKYTNENYEEMRILFKKILKKTNKDIIIYLFSCNCFFFRLFRFTIKLCKQINLN